MATRDVQEQDRASRRLAGTVFALFLVLAAVPFIYRQDVQSVSPDALMGRVLIADVKLIDGAGVPRTAFRARVSTERREQGWRILETVMLPAGQIERNSWRIDKLTRSAMRRDLLLRVDSVTGDADARGIWTLLAAARPGSGGSYHATKSIYHPGVGHGRLEVRFTPTSADETRIAARDG